MCSHDEVPPPRPGLIGRPPSDRPHQRAMHWTPPLVDVVDQLEALAALFARGLLSDEDVDRQKRRILGPRRHGAR